MRESLTRQLEQGSCAASVCTVTALVVVFVVFLRDSTFATTAGDVPQHADVDVPAERELTEIERMSVMCGPNSLYLMLRMSGRLIDDDVVSEYIPSRREGMSLVELRNACARFGLRTEVRCVVPQDLGANAPLPMVARIRATSSTLNDAHYVVVFEMDDETLTVVDATSGAIETYRRELLPNIWTGYVLVPVKNGVNATFSLLLVAWSLVFALVFAVMTLNRYVPSAWMTRGGFS